MNLTISGLRAHMMQAVYEANNMDHGMPEAIYRIRGMSARKNRNLLNRLCKIEPCHYLEIGMWQGSTLVSAAFGHEHGDGSIFHGIDNFSQFDKQGLSEQTLKRNIADHVPRAPIQLTNKSCWDVDPKELGTTFNIYNYDGKHDREDQEKALTHFKSVLAPVFIFICDDWNWEPAREGTYNGIAKAKMQIEAAVELYTPNRRNQCSDDWWNGTFVAVLTNK